MAIDKNTIMKEAQKFVTKGQFDKAIAEWKKLLKEAPNDPNIFNTIGDLCLKKDAKADACDAYKKAADILAADGFTSKAIALYKKVINIDPKKIEAHLALGDLNAEKGLSGNALESYKIAADYFLQLQDTAKALGIYQKMADLNSANVSFRIKLGDMYAKENMVSEASTAYLNAADVHMAKNEFKDARQLFEKVLSINPGNINVYHKAGIVYFQEGKFSEACKALKRVFENDPSNNEVANMYLDALFKSAREPEAEQVVRKILDSETTRTDLREKLVKIYLAKKEPNKALVEMTVILEAKIAEGDNDAAEKILKKFVSDAPEYIPGRKKLGDFYRSIGRRQDGADIYLQVAELLIETKDVEGAKTFLNKALELSPNLQEAREHLDRLEPAMLDAAPPEPIEEAMAPLAEPTPDYQQPAPKPAAMTISTFEENPAINEAFTEIDVLVKYGLASKALEQLEMLAVTYPDNPPIRIRLKDLYQEQGNASKAVEHALVLADIYSRNNLTDLSESILNSALSIDPTNAALLSKLGKAPILSEFSPPIAVPVSPPEPSIESPVIAEPFESASPPPITVPAASSEPSIKSPVPAEPFESASLEVSSPEPPPAFEDTLQFQEPFPADVITFEGLEPGIPNLDEQTRSADVFPQATAPAEEYGSSGKKLQPTNTSEKPVAKIPEPKHAVQLPIGGIPPDTEEMWSEAEFYFQQGLFDEAKKHYARIVELDPDNQRAIERLGELSREEEQSLEFSKLAEAVEELEGASDIEADGQELPLSVSDEDAVRTLMEEISKLKKQEPASLFPPAGKERVSPQQLEQPAGKKIEPFVTLASNDTQSAERLSDSEEDFFDLGKELNKESKNVSLRKPEPPTEDFFDLAAELRDELSTVAVPERVDGPSQEQSLDDIFEDFKRGVEEQSVKEDVDTHYNLGVAYKEMGLLDDAISEFILTPQHEPKFIQSRYMLGLCYMEKGEYQNAAAEILYALRCTASLGGNEQDTLGMHYDLGLSYQGAGNINSAINEFQIVLALKPGYRDTTTKLKELQQGDFISLDRLKDDIEREITSTFSKEGERIEREERNRKNEKVRN
jgi:pilus assembly protein FimV